MKKAFKIVGILLGIAGLVIIGLLTYFNMRLPDVHPAPTISVEATPERLERGKYLAYHVTGCVDCHSTRDWSRYAGPIIPGTEGKGGEEFSKEHGGVPGEVYASNITPTGIGGYTDGELLRAMTVGVTKENRALFPIMPYQAFSQLTREDANSILVYIRSLPPIENRVAESRLDFPMNLIVKTIPTGTYTPQPEPGRSDEVAYGKYLVNIAVCSHCHTPAERGTPIPEMDFAGGFEFTSPEGITRSSNITPDVQTGIGSWTRESFITRFKLAATEDFINTPVAPGELNTPMPWTMYGGMTEADLGAIFEYLRTVKPVRNDVEEFVPKK